MVRKVVVNWLILINYTLTLFIWRAYIWDLGLVAAAYFVKTIVDQETVSRGNCTSIEHVVYHFKNSNYIH